MTPETLLPAQGSAEEKAWPEIQAWYNNCITQAPKPDAMQPGVNIGHILRWCQSWDIDTAPIEAICAKHAAYGSIRPFANPFPRS